VLAARKGPWDSVLSGGPGPAGRPAPVSRRDTTSSAAREVAIEEGVNHRRHHVHFLFQREVAGIEQVKLRLRKISEIGCRPRRREDWLFLPPEDKDGWLTRGEVLLPLRIERRIGPVVQKEIELDLVVARAVEQELILGRPVGAHELRVLCARLVLP